MLPPVLLLCLTFTVYHHIVQQTLSLRSKGAQHALIQCAENTFSFQFSETDHLCSVSSVCIHIFHFAANLHIVCDGDIH